MVLTIREGVLQVLIVKRGTEPYRGRYALPGGFIHHGETAAEAARRELLEETGLDGGSLPLEPISYYDAVDRDPRGRIVTFPFLAVAPDLPIPHSHCDSDAWAATWKPTATLLTDESILAFDHAQILADAVTVARNKLRYTTIATNFCPEEFTISELRAVYEAVWGLELDRANFHRKVKNATEFIVETGNVRPGAEGRLGRPAKLYRAGDGDELSSPILLTLSARRD
ncbi:NUDIX domain-containing protein [Nocardia sp. NPDC058705]|uniref:NUDIX hydrolase n=1 Tax=Nocardia sp. NPDC058705 TaxID=3346609 RepID=UPI003694E049